MPGKFGDIIQKARQEENQNTDKMVYQLTDKPDNQETREPEVNLCIKVPKSLRQHWAAEAKRSGVTMTSVIMESLTQKFGLPENQNY